MSVEVDLLRAFAKALKVAAPFLPGVGPVVGRIAAAALGLGADFAEAGADAVASIERVQATDPVLKQVRDDWNEAIRAEFSEGTGGSDYPDDESGR